jgi:hypothetical protein
MAIQALLGALGGYLGNTKGARTGTYGSTTSGTSNVTTNRNLLPWQSSLADPLSGFASKMMTDPTSFLAPYRTQARSQVNANYAQVPQMLRDRLLSAGGASGKFGTATRQMEIGRLGGLDNVDNTFSSMIPGVQMGGAGLAEQLLNMNMGSSTSGNTTGTTAGTYTTPGSAGAGAIQGGMSIFSMLQQMMQQMLASGSGGAPALAAP